MHGFRAIYLHHCLKKLFESSQFCDSTFAASIICVAFISHGCYPCYDRYVRMYIDDNASHAPHSFPRAMHTLSPIPCAVPCSHCVTRLAQQHPYIQHDATRAVLCPAGLISGCNAANCERDDNTDALLFSHGQSCISIITTATTHHDPSYVFSMPSPQVILWNALGKV